MPNKYYLRSDRTAVQPDPNVFPPYSLKYGTPVDGPDRRYWHENNIKWEQHIKSLPALDVDPDYLKTLRPGWFEGEERYEWHVGEWVECTKAQYDSIGDELSRRLTIIAPQEAEKGQEGEPRILHGDTSGVCYNCLNGFHKGCDIKSCTCKKKDHKAWWWKTQAEIDSAQAVGVFQSGVREWLLACFGEEISNDIIERNHRFFEEAAELVQATGCTKSECHQLVDYVFDRPKGDPVQEVGGALVTLSALCSASGIDMAKAGETELARIWTKVEKIRAKQVAKPKHSPLPATPQPVTGEEDPFIKKHLDIIWRKLREAKIEGHIKPMFGGLESASIEHFLKTGTISGSFHNRLMEMMDGFRSRVEIDQQVASRPSDAVEEIDRLVKEREFMMTEIERLQTIVDSLNHT